MRTLPEGLLFHLQRTCTTLANCWILTRSDGTKLGFTDHDEALEIEAVTCKPESGLQPTQAVSQLGFAADNVDVAGALSDSSISERDVEAGKYDDARVAVWLVNWQSPDERVLLRNMVIGEVTREDQLFRAELRGFTALLDKVQGRTYGRNCDADLGDARCLIDLDQPEFSVEGTVNSVTEQGTISTNAMVDFARGWFSGGTIEWRSGANVGTRQRIASSLEPSADKLRLWDLPPEPIAPGDGFELVAGCDKRFTTCKAKFANHLNFRGFPHMPGNDFAMNYAANGNDHDGSPLIP
ncbi:DUF2163 domain-containing protein [Pseudahrensia aquimaris]|uniref:DUF2163 domain-containing protein n=1 Tax=Pseudahrensia aquimaris TaxID=744461 RepID=A0ABW3FFY0_9HYPH